ncbi:TPA: ankyrin repeat domain-containing protein [Escherichia coli]|nr:ankyrin repeat domain-containing protein [Escherichia coli]
MNDLEKARLLFEEFSPFSKIKDIVSFGTTELLEKFLLNNPEMNLSVTDNTGKNLLYFSLISENTEMSKYLLKNKPELAALKTEENKNLLHLAAIQNNKEMVNEFLNNKYINKHEIDNSGNTILHDAVLFASPEIIEQLLLAKIDPMIKNKNGETVLSNALNIHNKLNAYNNEIKLKIRRNIKKLVDMGVDFNQTLENGKTPLIEAIENNAVDMIKLAVALKTDFNKKDIHGNTALHYAAENMNFNIIKLFVNNGADINIKNDKGLTVPMIMAEKGFMNKEFMNYYIDKSNGYKLNTVDNNGNTLLHYCSSKKQLDTDCLDLLIQSNIKIDLKNNQGKTAKDIANKDNKNIFILHEKSYLSNELPLTPTIALKQKFYNHVS